jgi:hypothetical protein
MVEISHSVVSASRLGRSCPITVTHSWRVTYPLPRSARREHLFDSASLPDGSRPRFVNGEIVDGNGRPLSLSPGDRDYLRGVLAR